LSAQGQAGMPALLWPCSCCRSARARAGASAAYDRPQQSARRTALRRDYEVGPLPRRSTSLTMGTRKIRLVKDGYETLTVMQSFRRPGTSTCRWTSYPRTSFRQDPRPALSGTSNSTTVGRSDKQLLRGPSSCARGSRTANTAGAGGGRRPNARRRGRFPPPRGSAVSRFVPCRRNKYGGPLGVLPFTRECPVLV